MGPKRFEAKWIHEKNFRHTVEQAWASAGFADTGGVLSKLGRMHEALHAWDRSILKKPKHRLRDAQRNLENAMNSPLT
jgi:predicted negative regulator of RcsB-dependent stress response